MARVWNNVTNLENIKNRTILQLLENQTKLLEEYSKEIDRIEGIAESAENKAAAAQTAAEGAQTNAQQAAQSAQAAASSASAAQRSANEARIAANEAMADAERAANEAEDAQQSASSAASSAASAADKANTAAADAASAKATAESAAAGTAQNTTSINQINARETGYGETLSISGSNLSLMHGATALSTVTLPGGGGGSEIVARPLTGWKVQNRSTSLDITNAYYIPISDNIWYVCGKVLYAPPLSGNTEIQIIPPDGWGTPALVIGEVALGKTGDYSRTLPIISQPSGMSEDIIGVVPTPATPGGTVQYDSENLYSFFFMAIRKAGV